ncbi:dipeptidase [Lederbergia lenta]|uniref:Membrane dipeptidase n=1 Tax=Lederbergia lenta TaxID=1467 RepID=A0A2X4WED9_LEDLE|nr:dipeptidase [Lederbergia lenta]MCM3110551.1 dipeptidase [Lederbergia lenta]MEC2323883.1 dipeptidase [Lederbergia lenta]SQI61129.1 membrane dipeptidase [Lederbergia lenta]
MKIIDLHCDALYKIWKSNGSLRFRNSEDLDTNIKRLKKGEVKVQCFAIFIPPELKSEEKFQAALDQVDYFYTNVIGNNYEMKHIKEWQDFDRLRENEIGAMLTLEGVDCIGNDLHKLSVLHHLGVRSIGLTWNNANLAADGVGESRGAGLSSFGKAIVQFNNMHQLLTDVSHLSEKAFWDVMELATYPIASHSNAKAVCAHPRNLSDAQAKVLFEKKAMVHIVYFPDFVTEARPATMTDLIKHIDHFCALGGINQVGFGSDFDGITRYIYGLENASKQQYIINELLKYYSHDQVSGFAWRNFLESRPV